MKKSLKLLSLPIALCTTVSLVATTSCSQKGTDPVPAADLFDIAVPPEGIVLSSNKSINVTITCNKSNWHVLKNIKLMHDSQTLSTINDDKNMVDGNCNLTFENINLPQTINNAVIQFNYDSNTDIQEIKRITIKVNQPSPTEPTFSIEPGAAMSDETHAKIKLTWECTETISIQNDNVLTFKFAENTRTAKISLSDPIDKTQEINLTFEDDCPIWENLTDGCFIFNYKNETTGKICTTFINNVSIVKFIPTVETQNLKFTIDNDSRIATIDGLLKDAQLETLTIPKYVYQKVNNEIKGYLVVSISDNAFKNNKLLTTITLPNTINSIGIRSFSWCKALENIVIPESVYWIGNSAFEGCVSLKTIAWPVNITQIADGMFSGCNSLESINIPKEVTSIGNKCFEGCLSLSSITFPEQSKLKSIGSQAFDGVADRFSLDLSNTSNEYIVVSGEKILGTDESKISDYRIYVPNDLVDQYKVAENWKDYQAIITYHE